MVQPGVFSGPRVRTRQVVVAWMASRVALILFVGLASYLIGFDRAQRWQTFGGWLMGRFSWADSYHYLRIAEKGYLPPGLRCCDQAFFPGYPVAIRLVQPVVGGNATLAALLVAHLAAVLAAVLLWRLADHLTGDPRVAVIAVGLLAVAPYGVFLGSVFTESLFLALALAAWWTASRRLWWAAGLCAGLAATVRVNGLFLGAGLAVLYVCQLRADSARDAGRVGGGDTGGGGGRGWRLAPRLDALALAVPLVAVGGYTAYLHALTGSWTAWSDALATGWNRGTTWPWVGLVADLRFVRAGGQPDLLLAGVAEIAATVFGVALVVALLWLRRWPEAVYVGASVAALLCAGSLQSAPRYALVWFPGYLLLAQLAVRPGWRWVAPAAVACCLPLMATVSLALAAHLWVA